MGLEDSKAFPPGSLQRPNGSQGGDFVDDTGVMASADLPPVIAASPDEMVRVALHWTDGTPGAPIEEATEQHPGRRYLD